MDVADVRDLAPDDHRKKAMVGRWRMSCTKLSGAIVCCRLASRLARFSQIRYCSASELFIGLSMRYVFVILIVGVVIASSGCTYLRQLSKPPTWGMTNNELWLYENVQSKKFKLNNMTIRLTDSGTATPLAEVSILAVPRPGISPIGRPRTRCYQTNSDGVVTLEKLPSGAETWISLDGFSAVPLMGLLDDGQISIGDSVIDLLDDISLKAQSSSD